MRKSDMTLDLTEGSVRKRLIQYAVPLVAVFLGTAFERIDIAGFVLVLSTGFILNVRKRKD